MLQPVGAAAAAEWAILGCYCRQSTRANSQDSLTPFVCCVMHLFFSSLFVRTSWCCFAAEDGWCASTA